MRNLKFFLVLPILFSGINLLNAQQQQGPPDPVDIAYKEADRLTKELELNPHQIFYVDSILQYNLAKMYDRLEELQKSGMQNRETFELVQKKWFDKTYAAFKLVLSEDQYYEYMISIGKGKELKAARKAAEKKRKKEEKMAKKAKKKAKK